MRNVGKVVASIVATGEIDHELTSAEFGGNNRGMDGFRAALKEANLELDYEAYARKWTIAPLTARAAFDIGQTYRPRVFGEGSRANQPSGKYGVELWGGLLVMVEYMAAGFANGAPFWTKKRAIRYRHVDPAMVQDHFKTNYREVPDDLR